MLTCQSKLCIDKRSAPAIRLPDRAAATVALSPSLVIRSLLPHRDLDLKIPRFDEPVIRRFPLLGLQMASKGEVKVADKHRDQLGRFEKRYVPADAGS